MNPNARRKATEVADQIQQRVDWARDEITAMAADACRRSKRLPKPLPKPLPDSLPVCLRLA